MRTILPSLALLICAGAILCAATPPPAPGELHRFVLDLTPEQPTQLDTNTTVYVEMSTDLGAVKAWAPLTNVVGTVTNIILELPDEQAFFRGFESNKLGVSDFFAVESKPRLPGNRQLGIRIPPKN